MSVAPQNTLNRTRVLIKDIIFQEKYRLSHTQVDIMAYIINALTWTTKIGAFFPLSNRKFHKDLPQISEKTLEEGLRALKSMELIEVQMITVPAWKNAHVRGIKILPKGMDYNASFYTPDEQEIINNLKEQNHAKELEIAQLKEQLSKMESVEVPQEAQKIEDTNEEIIEESKAQDDGINYDDLGFTELIQTVTKEFGATSQPICNAVKGWQKESQFYINSYNKLTVISPSGQMAQLKNPIEISDFWKFISANREKIGKVIDYTKKLDVEELTNRYEDMNIVLQKIPCKVQHFQEVEGGVQVVIQDSQSGKVTMLSRDKEVITFGFEECEKVLLGLR